MNSIQLFQETGHQYSPYMNLSLPIKNWYPLFVTLQDGVWNPQLIPAPQSLWQKWPEAPNVNNNQLQYDNTTCSQQHRDSVKQQFTVAWKTALAKKYIQYKMSTVMEHFKYSVLENYPSKLSFLGKQLKSANAYKSLYV